MIETVVSWETDGSAERSSDPDMHEAGNYRDLQGAEILWRVVRTELPMYR